jgi:vacuolar-type H+-ATPase subunit E/Vma4
MTETTQSHSESFWPFQTGLEASVTSLPSWIAPPPIAPTRSLRPFSTDAAASVVPPSLRVSMSLLPLLAPRISVQDFAETAVPYPDLRDENEALCRQLATMAGNVARLRRDVLEASEGALVRLAIAIAERVARHELAIDPALVTRWAREAIETLASKEDVVIAIAPDLAAKLHPEEWERAAGRSVRIETDASLGPSKCEVRAGASKVDASVEGRLSAVVRQVETTNE